MLLSFAQSLPESPHWKTFLQPLEPRFQNAVSILPWLSPSKHNWFCQCGVYPQRMNENTSTKSGGRWHCTHTDCAVTSNHPVKSIIVRVLVPKIQCDSSILHSCIPHWFIHIDVTQLKAALCTVPAVLLGCDISWEYLHLPHQVSTYSAK